MCTSFNLSSEKLKKKKHIIKIKDTIIAKKIVEIQPCLLYYLLNYVKIVIKKEEFFFLPLCFTLYYFSIARPLPIIIVNRKNTLSVCVCMWILYHNDNLSFQSLLGWSSSEK